MKIWEIEDKSEFLLKIEQNLYVFATFATKLQKLWDSSTF